MAVYVVAGKLGTGKTKFCVWRARLALKEGRRVASNVDLNIAKLVPSMSATYIRVPDKPTADDLHMIGHGNPESYDEDRNGVLILDELGSWLNARGFQDKSRAGVIDWLIHARKLGWDVYLIAQHADMIDKQVRQALVEYSCNCMRLDKVRIPFVGKIINDLFGKRWGYLPRMHLVTARVGQAPNTFIAEKWYYKGDEFHDAYDTRQVFSESYPHGSFSAWPKSPAPPVRLGWWARLKQRPARPTPKPKRPEVAAVMSLPPGERLARLRGLDGGSAPMDSPCPS